MYNIQIIENATSNCPSRSFDSLQSLPSTITAGLDNVVLLAIQSIQGYLRSGVVDEGCI